MARKTSPKRSATGSPARKTQPVKTTAKPKSQQAAKTPKPTKRDRKTVVSTNTSPSPEQLHVRAYEIWLRKGQPIGQDEQNWLEAEAELLQSPR